MYVNFVSHYLQLTVDHISSIIKTTGSNSKIKKWRVMVIMQYTSTY